MRRKVIGLLAVVLALAGVLGWRMRGGALPEPPFIITVQGMPAAQIRVNRPGQTLTVYDAARGRMTQMPLERYVLGAVAGEMPASYALDALRAQAVASRTYALYLKAHGGCSAHPGADVCTDFSHCQAYLDAQERAQAWADCAEIYEQTLAQAVQDTENMVLTYDGALALALFHANAGGKTADSQEVFAQALPYLCAVDSDEPAQQTRLRFDRATLARALGTRETPRIESVSASGRAALIRAGDSVFTGAQLRRKLGLPSARFDIEETAEEVVFVCQGYGHGVGMSQQGAQTLAQQGWQWREILLYYYTGAQIADAADLTGDP